MQEQTNGKFASVKHPPNYTVVSHYSLPDSFHRVYKTNGKYAVSPTGSGIVLAVLIYWLAMNYKFDLLSAAALGAVVVLSGVMIGNFRVRNLIYGFESHPSVLAFSEDSGIPVSTAAKTLSNLALKVSKDDMADIGSDEKMFVNVYDSFSEKHDPFSGKKKMLARESQSFGLMRKVG